MNNSILLVDDEINILNSFKRTLRNKFPFDVAQSGADALKMIENNKAYAVVISDMKMPAMNGLELLARIKKKSPNTVRIMLTGNADQKTAIDAVNIGDIFRFITKPCDAQTLIRTIEAGVEQYQLVIAEKILLNKTLKGTINVLTEVLTVVNPEVFNRVVQLKKYMLELAKSLDMPMNWSFEPMIQLSQLGRIMLPNTKIQHKKETETLSAEQRRLIERHPCLAADLIRKIPRMMAIAQTILYQNKCFNGEGIPHDEVKGKDIPYGARMLKIVIDFLDFVEQGVSHEQAILQLETQAQFYDPSILIAFRQSINLTKNTCIELIKLSELSNNMIIQESLKTSAGLLVAAKGQQVTEPLIRIIKHCLENKALEGKIIISKQQE